MLRDAADADHEDHHLEEYTSLDGFSQNARGIDDEECPLPALPCVTLPDLTGNDTAATAV